MAVAALAVLASVAWCAPLAGASGAVSVVAVVNGQSALTSSDAHPAQLYGTRFDEVRIVVTNDGGSTVRISSVRLEGQVLALPLFSYDTAVLLVVPPRHTESLSFPVSMSGIGNQATGLVVGTVNLLDANGAEVASQSIVTDVHGSLGSLYGIFGLAVLLLTVSSLALALVAMGRHTLPQNRAMRGVRFMIPGFGVGLVLTFSLAAFGVFTAGPGHWLPLLLVTTVAGFAVGYLTPAPEEEELDDYDDDVLLAQIVVVDEDPLVDGNGQVGEEFAMSLRPTGGVADSRPTGAPDSRPTGAPDSRPTGAPDSRPTGAP
jgi:hypothetical protein